MRFLLDTHVWLWLLESPDKLAPSVRATLEGAEDLVLSVASVWEAAIKVELGKLAPPGGAAGARDEFVQQAGARELPIRSAHVLLAAQLPPHHKDPFDRLLVAQAQIEALTLVTADDRVRAYAPPILWAV